MAEYFEDMAVGDTDSYGSYTVTESEIIDFAEQFDPQPFHVDPEAAEQSHFGGLVASGWHTASLTMRLIVTGFLSETASQGALGVDELRWLAPLRPGDTITVHTEVLSKEPWSETAGKVDVRIEARVDDETICSMVGLVLFTRRDAVA